MLKSILFSFDESNKRGTHLRRKTKEVRKNLKLKTNARIKKKIKSTREEN
jgi:hypothetical protein